MQVQGVLSRVTDVQVDGDRLLLHYLLANSSDLERDTEEFYGHLAGLLENAPGDPFRRAQMEALSPSRSSKRKMKKRLRCKKRMYAVNHNL